MLNSCVAALGTKGVLGMVGVPPHADVAVPFNVSGAIMYGLTIKGIIEGDADPKDFIPELLRHQAEGRFPFERLITQYPLAEINGAIDAQARGDCIKVVLRP